MRCFFDYTAIYLFIFSVCGSSFAKWLHSVMGSRQKGLTLLDKNKKWVNTNSVNSSYMVISLIFKDRVVWIERFHVWNEFPQVFIVTGGIGGIGRKITERLMSLGALVIISKDDFVVISLYEFLVHHSNGNSKISLIHLYKFLFQLDANPWMIPLWRRYSKICQRFHQSFGIFKWNSVRSVKQFNLAKWFEHHSSDLMDLFVMVCNSYWIAWNVINYEEWEKYVSTLNSYVIIVFQPE